MTSRDAPTKVIRYHFVFEDGSRHGVTIELDRNTLAMRAPERETWPEWTRLGFRQCPNCPLSESTHPQCPIARNMVDVVELLKDRLSYEKVDVSVEVEGRTYSKRTDLQSAAMSLVGIFTTTSGCPVLDKLRPMVDTHLPFMTSDEASYRMIGMYLMAQYFQNKWGQRADWKLDDLVTFLREARETNASYCRRLQSLGVKDAALNALSDLNAQGEITSMSIETADMARLEQIFRQHYGGD